MMETRFPTCLLSGIVALSCSTLFAATAGHETPGTDAYPNGGFQRVDGIATGYAISTSALAVDEANGIAIVAPSPSTGLLVKVDLATFDVLDTLRFQGRYSLDGCVLDNSGQFAYVGANYGPGKILKIDVPNFRLADELDLDFVEHYPSLGWRDPAGDHAYFKVGHAPGRIVKIDLQSFTKVGHVEFNSGEDDIRCGVIDPQGKYGYFGTYTNPAGFVVKVDLETMTRVGAITNSPANSPRYISATIDPNGDYAYFGTFQSAGRIAKFDLSTFSHVSTISLNSGENNPSAALMHPDGSTAYFVGNDRFVTIDLATFTRTSGTSFTEPFARPWLNAAGTKVWALGSKSVHAIDMGTLTADHSLAFEGYSEIAGQDLAFASQNLGRAYLTGSNSGPGRILQLDPTTLAIEAVVELESADGAPNWAVVDEANDTAYLASSDRVIKFDLATMTRVGHLSSSWITGLEIDPAGGALYVLRESLPNLVQRVDLDTFDWDGTLTTWVHGVPFRSAIDTAAGLLYWGTQQSPTRIVRVDLGTFSVIDELVLDSGDDDVQSLVVDPSTDSLLVGLENIVRVDTTTFTRAGELDLVSLSLGWAGAGLLDSSSGLAYFRAGSIVEVAPNPLSLVRTASTLPGEDGDRLAYIQSQGVFIAPTPNFPSSTAKLALGHAGKLRATKFELGEPADVTDMRFYSHAAAGNLRLALYDNAVPRNLLWTSGEIANGTAGGEVVVDIADGTPATLSLPIGTYWAAWQIDTQDKVPSYTAGTAGDSLHYPMAFGAEPTILYPIETTESDEVWTQYITYDVIPDVTAPTSVAAADSATQVGGDITGTYTAEDDVLGTGVASVVLYVRQPGESWTNAGAVTGGTWTHTPTAGSGAYHFKTVATDNSTNTETAPAGTSGTGDVTVVYNATANGTVAQDVATGSDEYVFPMEPGLDVIVLFDNVTGSGSLSVSRTLGDNAPTGYPSIGIANQFWTLTAGGGLTFDSATIVIHYNEDELGMDESLLDIVYRDASGVVTTPPFTIDTVANTITIANVTAFSDWYVGNTSGLPVELDLFMID